MIWLILFLFAVLAAAGLGLLAAWSDFRTMRIPNLYCALIALLFPVAFFAAAGTGLFQSITTHAGAAALVFVVTAGLFFFRLFGAGDAKLLSAFAPWMGMGGLPAFVLYVAFAGGLLGLAALALRKFKPVSGAPEGSWLARVQAGEGAVPYGVAITAGAILAFINLGYVGFDRLAVFLQG